MNVERHIRKLNRMIEAELGNHPKYAWIYSESSDFRRAMRIIRDDGSLVYDYRCPCGLNATVHSPECIAGKLVIAEPVYEVRKTIPSMQNQWVFCALLEPPPESVWRKIFGTKLHYPETGEWAPVETETQAIATPPDTLPGENITRAIINARARTREVPDSDTRDAYLTTEARKDRARKDNIYQRVRQALPVAPKESISWGGVGLSPVLRQKISQGEQLVTL